MAVLSGRHHRAVERHLALAGIDMEAARARGDYLAVDSEQLADRLVVGGEVDADHFGEVTHDLFRAAADRPGETRICGDLATVLWDAGEIDAVLTLEHLWNQVRATPAFQLLCLYSTSVIEAATEEDFSTVCALHTEVRPVESYLRLLDPDIRRALVLLDAQERSHHARHAALSRRRLELESALEQALEQADDQRAQFRHAISSRDVIGQAKGILMVRWRVDEDTAFAMLRDASSRSHRKLRAVAEAVVAHQLRRN